MTFERPARFKALALIGLAALGLAACSSSSKSSTSTNTTASGGGGGSATSSGGGASSGTTLKLGFFGALTGANAQLGINIEDGEKLAISQYNATNPSVKVT